jgi:hypothetical protein
MAWFLVVGAVIGAWALLSLLCGERRRRIEELEMLAQHRRREAERRRKIEASIPTAGEITPVNQT